mmetsp:Transcript_10219/g.18637  ORF Transcript_10219/g.18637 Transcript_10219/m.18637 type:complete len:306 (+) Transcript_10219:178-1095(+)
MLTDALTSPSFFVALAVVLFFQIFKGRDTKSNLSEKDRGKLAVLVTGASRGIGKTIAAHLSFVGYTVFGGVRSQSSYDELLKTQESGKAKGKIIPVMLDVTSSEDIAAAFKTCEKTCKENNLNFVGIINNAGINLEGDGYKEAYARGEAPENILADDTVVMKVLDTNVAGCFRVTKTFVPLLDKEKGRIILMGSYFGTISGALGLPHLAYECSKFALEGLADGLRRGLKDKGIKVSLIKPGNIQTDMNSLGGESPPIVVSHDILTALEAKRPSPRYYPGQVKGLPCKNICDFFALLPSWLTDTQI